jgi:FkbM family methyltransferase
MYLNIRESPMMLARALGTYEDEKFATIDRLLKPGDVFVDVGANVGDFSLFASPRVAPSGQVVAIEPEPANVGWLKKSIDLNGLENVVVIEGALGEEAEGSRELYLSEIGGRHSLSDQRASELGSVPVVTRSLDALIANGEVRSPTVVKVDVEGWELPMLRGAERLLRSGGLVLLVEVHPQRGVDPLEVAGFLRACGYQVVPGNDLGADGQEVTPQTRELIAANSIDHRGEPQASG